MGRNVIILGADMTSSVHVENKKEDILILGERPTQGLDHVTLTAEAKYHINFTQSSKRFMLSLHYKIEVSYLLMVQKYISSKQKTLKYKIMDCA